MTPQLAWLIIGIVAVGLLHHMWHVWRYPLRACSRCGGSGKTESTDARGRKVVGECRKLRCRNLGPLTPRRRSQR